MCSDSSDMFLNRNLIYCGARFSLEDVNIRAMENGSEQAEVGSRIACSNDNATGSGSSGSDSSGSVYSGTYEIPGTLSVPNHRKYSGDPWDIYANQTTRCPVYYGFLIVQRGTIYIYIYIYIYIHIYIQCIYIYIIDYHHCFG